MYYAFDTYTFISQTVEILHINIFNRMLNCSVKNIA